MEMLQGQRMRLFTLVEFVVVLLMIGFLALAAVPRLAAAREDSLRAATRSALESVVVEQGRYVGEHGRYAAAAARLSVRLGSGVSVRIHQADAGGWSGTVEHAGLPGERCGVFVGSADPFAAAPASQEGLVRCTF